MKILLITYLISIVISFLLLRNSFKNEYIRPLGRLSEILFLLFLLMIPILNLMLYSFFFINGHMDEINNKKSIDDIMDKILFIKRS